MATCKEDTPPLSEAEKKELSTTIDMDSVSLTTNPDKVNFLKTQECLQEKEMERGKKDEANARIPFPVIPLPKISASKQWLPEDKMRIGLRRDADRNKYKLFKAAATDCDQKIFTLKISHDIDVSQVHAYFEWVEELWKVKAVANLEFVTGYYSPWANYEVLQETEKTEDEYLVFHYRLTRTYPLSALLEILSLYFKLRYATGEEKRKVIQRRKDILMKKRGIKELLHEKIIPPKASRPKRGRKKEVEFIEEEKPIEDPRLLRKEYELQFGEEVLVQVDKGYTHHIIISTQEKLYSLSNNAFLKLTNASLKDMTIPMKQRILRERQKILDEDEGFMTQQDRSRYKNLLETLKRDISYESYQVLIKEISELK